MNRDVMWAPWETPGLEHLHLSAQRLEIAAGSVIIGLKDQAPYRAWYEIHCDALWHTRRVIVMLLGDRQGQGMVIDSDGQGHWSLAQADQQPMQLEMLDGCLDVDLSATPFTHTLPIRRLRLKPGESGEIAAVSIAIPDLAIGSVRQRYTCLEQNLKGARYHVADLSTGFECELPVDANGLVIDYPDRFRRVWSEPEGAA